MGDYSGNFTELDAYDVVTGQRTGTVSVTLNLQEASSLEEFPAQDNPGVRVKVMHDSDGNQREYTSVDLNADNVFHWVRFGAVAVGTDGRSTFLVSSSTIANVKAAAADGDIFISTESFAEGNSVFKYGDVGNYRPLSIPYFTASGNLIGPQGTRMLAIANNLTTDQIVNHTYLRDMDWVVNTANVDLTVSSITLAPGGVGYVIDKANGIVVNNGTLRGRPGDRGDVLTNIPPYTVSAVPTVGGYATGVPINSFGSAGSSLVVGSRALLVVQTFDNTVYATIAVVTATSGTTLTFQYTSVLSYKGEDGAPGVDGTDGQSISRVFQEPADGGQYMHVALDSGAITTFFIPDGQDAEPFTIMDGIYTVSTLPGYEDAFVNKGYIVLDTSPPTNTYDLYIKTETGSNWTVVDDWGGVPGPAGANGRNALTYNVFLTSVPPTNQGTNFPMANFNRPPVGGEVFMAYYSTGTEIGVAKMLVASTGGTNAYCLGQGNISLTDSTADALVRGKIVTTDLGNVTLEAFSGALASIDWVGWTIVGQLTNYATNNSVDGKIAAAITGTLTVGG